jgi:membrane protein
MVKKTSTVDKCRAGLQSWLDESALLSPGRRSRLRRFVHFWVLVIKSFIRNRCPIRASALSFSTLLAMIPMLAVAISVTSSLLKKEGEDQIYVFIDKCVNSLIPPATITNAPTSDVEFDGDVLAMDDWNQAATNRANAGSNTTPITPMAGQTNRAAATPTVSAGGTNASVAAATDQARMETAQKEAARYIHNFIQNIRGGTLGVAGMVLLVFVAIRMLSSIEATFNDIWGVTHGRNWLLSIVLYWTTITLGPLLLAGTLALASSPHFAATQKYLEQQQFLGGFIFQCLPVALLWVAFAAFYKAVPNTKVNFGAAFVGAIVAGTAWHVNNLFGFLYVSRVVSNNKIYGGLFLVPVFMAGLYLSWLILLFGAQVAYAFQNRALYLQEKLAENVNQRGREFVAFRLMTCLGQRFQRGLSPATAQDMSAELGIPSRLVQQVLQTLIAARLVIEISGTEPAYTPARPLENITAHHVLMAMRAAQGQELIARDEPVGNEVYGEFARIQEAEKQAASSVTMLALVNRAQARLELAPLSPVDEKEIELAPALVPKIEPTAPEVAGEKSAPAGKPSELPGKSAGTATPDPETEHEKTESSSAEASAKSKSGLPPAATATEIIQPSAEQFASTTKQPTTEDEREFPL